MALVLNDALGVGLQLVDFNMSYLPTSVPYMPFPAHSPTQATMNVSTGGISPSSAILASVDVSNDPVTKAVMENVIGRLPQKKPKVTVRCEACNLEFSSQMVLNSHMAGSKHQRKVKAQDLLKSLEEKEKGFERDEISGVIRCTLCDITVNSPQLLATHIAGNKHKQKANSNNSSSPPAPAKVGGKKRKKGKNANTGGSPAKQACTGEGITGQTNGNSTATTTTTTTTATATATTTTPKVPDMDIPDYVQKLEDTKGGGKYLCNPCQVHCNAIVQLAQHLKSRKHVDVVTGNAEKKKAKWTAYMRGRRRPSFRGGPSMGRGRGLPISHTYTQPLSSNFVHGGALM